MMEVYGRECQRNLYLLCLLTTHHGQGVRLENGDLVLPLLGDEYGDRQPLLWQQQWYTAGGLERTLIQ
jgi:hypothetical protein